MSVIAANALYKRAGKSTACLLSLCASLPAFAHHSPSAYDQSTEAIIEGVLTEISWRNPHVYLTVETTGADGSSTSREIEAAAASALIAIGVEANDMQVGEQVSVRVHLNRRGPELDALGLAITRANGTVLALRGNVVALPPPQDQATGLAGIWSPESGTFLALAQTAQQWPFTEAGRAAAADFAARSEAAADCAPFGPPIQMMMPGLVAVVIANDRVTFDLDGQGASRVVHLDVQTPPATVQPTTQGYSIGQWQGETLAVETTAFAADPEGLGYALPSSTAKHVSERFTLSEDRRTLNYEATLEDPRYLTEPVRVSTIWSYRPDLKTSGQGCDLESAQRFQATP